MKLDSLDSEYPGYVSGFCCLFLFLSIIMVIFNSIMMNGVYHRKSKPVEVFIIFSHITFILWALGLLIGSAGASAYLRFPLLKDTIKCVGAFLTIWSLAWFGLFLVLRRNVAKKDIIEIRNLLAKSTFIIGAIFHVVNLVLIIYITRRGWCPRTGSYKTSNALDRRSQNPQQMGQFEEISLNSNAKRRREILE